MVIPNLIEHFLLDLDEELRKQAKTIRCCDIYDAYMKMFNQLKEYRSNSSGFTGLSEFLIFRLLIHSIPLTWIKRSISKDCISFISQDGELELSQGISLSKFNITLKPNISPDIAVFVRKRLDTVFQIKIYLPNGIHTFLDELNNFKKLKQLYPHLRAIFLMYHKLSSKGSIKNELDELCLENNWIEVISLQDNKRTFSSEMQKYLLPID